jgi:hypothetical protein
MTTIIPEQDKLGPLASPPPAATSPSYGDPAALRAIVLAAVNDALEPARSARARAGARPGAAVHDVRKAIRRTRAIVDLLGNTLPRRERKDLRKALVQARRSLGPARDLAVASDTLVHVAKAPEVAPAASAIVAAARADAPPLDSVADDVNRAIDVALAQGEALAAALAAPARRPSARIAPRIAGAAAPRSSRTSCRSSVTCPPPRSSARGCRSSTTSWARSSIA